MGWRDATSALLSVEQGKSDMPVLAVEELLDRVCRMDVSRFDNSVFNAICICNCIRNIHATPPVGGSSFSVSSAILLHHARCS